MLMSFQFSKFLDQTSLCPKFSGEQKLEKHWIIACSQITKKVSPNQRLF